jgi:hypothetical protein
MQQGNNMKNVANLHHAHMPANALARRIAAALRVSELPRTLTTGGANRAPATAFAPFRKLQTPWGT